MTKKLIYYIILIVVTVACIFVYLTYTGAVHKSFTDYKNTFILNQTIAPQRLYINAWKNAQKKFIDPTMNGQDWSKWQNRYNGYIKTEEDAKVAINTMLASLDDTYSKFMSLPEFEDQSILFDSSISGIGINLMEIANRLVISNVMEDSPAQKAGLLIGDIILRVDDKNTADISLAQTIQLIRGQNNTIVKLQILRKKQILTKEIKRGIVKLKNINAKILNNNIGYIQIGSFMGKDAPQEFEQALKNTQNTMGLIIDLRGDTGGLLSNAIAIANMMIEKGNILNIVHRNGVKISITAQDNTIFRDKPLILLVNKGTASSAEILAGALRENINATIVGQRTYGKNSIQQIIPMPNKTGMNLTIAKYLMPNDEDIHNLGIKPDYEVTFQANSYDETTDTQLNKAISIIKEIIKKQS